MGVLPLLGVLPICADSTTSTTSTGTEKVVIDSGNLYYATEEGRLVQVSLDGDNIAIFRIPVRVKDDPVSRARHVHGGKLLVVRSMTLGGQWIDSLVEIPVTKLPEASAEVSEDDLWKLWTDHRIGRATLAAR